MPLFPTVRIQAAMHVDWRSDESGWIRMVGGAQAEDPPFPPIEVLLGVPAFKSIADVEFDFGDRERNGDADRQSQIIRETRVSSSFEETGKMFDLIFEIVFQATGRLFLRKDDSEAATGPDGCLVLFMGVIFWLVVAGVIWGLFVLS